MTDIPSCPFCGEGPKSSTFTFNDGAKVDYACCKNPDCPYDGRTMRLEKWIVRPLEDALQKRIDILDATAKAHQIVDFNRDVATDDLMLQQQRIEKLEGALKEIQRLSQKISHFKTNLYAREIYWDATEALASHETQEVDK